MTSPLRTLVILRHAKAEPGMVGDDQVRALALAGRKQAAALGASLSTGGLQPELVLCSTALRTKQTWELLSHGLDQSAVLDFRAGLYAASVDDLMSTIGAIESHVHNVLLIGHEPSVSAVASLLAGPDSAGEAVAQVRVGVPTATYSVLKSELSWRDWHAHSARVERVVRV